MACTGETFFFLARGRLENSESIGKKLRWGELGEGLTLTWRGKLPGAELPFLNPSLELVGLASMQGELLLIYGFRWNGAFSYLQCSWPPAFNLHFWIKNFLFAMILGCYELQWGRNRAAGCFSSWVLVSLLSVEGATLPYEWSRARQASFTDCDIPLGEAEARCQRRHECVIIRCWKENRKE